MQNSDLVRFSRDGDQFHYLWAARRCLKLLSFDTNLVAISIEGASTGEIESNNSLEDGEELIDIGEYYGSQSLQKATLIRYLQLKHSTKKTTVAWTLSRLKNTLEGFADRFKALEKQLGVDSLDGRFEFCFITNRPISTDITETIDDITSSAPSRHPGKKKNLKKYTALDELSLLRFCKLLRIEGDHDGYWDQRNILFQDVSGYLPDADIDSPVQLKELVTRKALSESSSNPTITKEDVLRALKTDETRLFPANCQIEEIKGVVPRVQESELIEKIVSTEDAPVIVHAAAGVGKTVFSTHIYSGLPAGSLCIVYDCFGNGQYRSSSSYRHRHKDALTQISNELAAKRVCHPIIPTVSADSASYMKAFIYRLKQSVTLLKAENQDALLCVVIDAADNAQMAAEEIGETNSFARDLLRENLPPGVRLVLICRTHRQELLDPPPRAVRLELNPFSSSETGVHLRGKFPKATELDVDEFHRLSSHNPRVQATALAREASLTLILRRLGPNPTSVDDTISALLNKAIEELRYKAGSIENRQIELICEGLAVLKPLIPIPVLALISGVDEAAIKSFSIDLGRPLVLIGETIQFFDEPAETWFRERFKPNSSRISDFLEKLKPHAGQNSYIASILPQLMLEANQFDELVSLSLSSEGLPGDSPLERRDIELQRLHFALKASLRASRYLDATKLALKAGGETAGNERQQKLLQENTDLASVSMDVDRIREIVSRKNFGGGWIGSHHAYEASIMSSHAELRGEAQSRLRMAYEWLRNWATLTKEQRRSEKVTNSDIAELAVTRYNIHGPESCLDELCRWRPREIAFRTGRILARRFIDHGRFDDLERLAFAAGNDLCIILAITSELAAVNKFPPKEVVERALRLLLNSRVKVSLGDSWNGDEIVLGSVTAMVVAGIKLLKLDKKELASLIGKYLPEHPPYGLTSGYDNTRYHLFRAYVLKYALEGDDIELINLAPPNLQKELEDTDSSRYSQEIREFKGLIGSLLPWHKLWASVILGNTKIERLNKEIDNHLPLKLDDFSIRSYERHRVINGIARIWFETLVMITSERSDHFEKFANVVKSLERPLFTSTITDLSRVAGRHERLGRLSLDFARKSFDIISGERSDAEEISNSYIALARSVLAVSQLEATEYFNQAIIIINKIGDENLFRWSAILDLADQVSDPGQYFPEVAYKFSRSAELTYDYVARDKHFDWASTVNAIVGLCPCSSYAILSRWRDRGFGLAERLFPVVTRTNLERGNLDPLVAITLLCFSYDWDESFILDKALDACTSEAEKEEALSFFLKYSNLQNLSVSELKKVRVVVESHDTKDADLDDLFCCSKKNETSKKLLIEENDTNESDEPSEQTAYDWEKIFSEIDLNTENGISTAFARFKEEGPPYEKKNYFNEACKRIAIGREADFIRVIKDMSVFGFYDFNIFIEELPEAWGNSLAVESALRDLVITYCRRFSTKIHKNRYYQPIPFDKLNTLIDISDGEIADIVLSTVGETQETMSSDRLFSLVGLLALKLSKAESLEALSFSLEMFDAIFKEADGDGNWDMSLMPPKYIDASVAGYIWAALAAPQTNIRWEAAHVVRGLCKLNREKVLKNLIEYAKKMKGGPFVDTRLHFYKFHALQWFLVALERSAKENPDTVSKFGEFLVQIAFDEKPHVIIKEFASKAALSLQKSGEYSLKTDIVTDLKNANRTIVPVEVSNPHNRKSPEIQSILPDHACEEFHFGIDMDQYWFSELAECFGISVKKIENEASFIIIKDWGHSSLDHWKKDERLRRNLFKEGESYHSHSSYPRTDDLRFYLSYHAMMAVAGKLLKLLPVHQDPDDEKDGFSDWISGHLLTRDDGNWLSDRRDPAPKEHPIWDDSIDNEIWPWSVTKEYFETILGLPQENLSLWGSWTHVDNRRKESIDIRSALVSSSNSNALVRALQTVHNPMDYRIPDSSDDLQFDSGNFILKGWVSRRDSSFGIDEYDPWSGGISYPPVAPDQYICGLMSIEPDYEKRIWRKQLDGPVGEVIWSRLWGSNHYADEEYEGEKGSRLQAAHTFISDLLKRMDMDLIVEIGIRRKIRSYHYEKSKGEYNGYIPPYTRIFLIRQNGRIYSV